MKTLFGIGTLLALFLSTHAAGQDAPKTGAAVYDDFVEPWRGRFIATWKGEVASIKKGIERYRQLSGDGKTAKERELNYRLLLASEKRLTSLEKNTNPWIGAIRGGLASPKTWEVGDFGRSAHTPHIVQVLPPDRVLLGAKGEGPLLMMKVRSTAGLLDGRQFDFEGRLLHVTGTTTYKTVSGGTRTVLVAEFVDLESIRKRETEAERSAREAASAVKAKEEQARKETESKRQREAAEKAARLAAVQKEADDARREAAAKVKAENAAEASLALTKDLIRLGKTDLIRQRLERVIKLYPDTAAAKEARELLKKY